MTDDSHYKVSSRPHFGEMPPCEKGIVFPVKKCIGCEKFDDCTAEKFKTDYRYKEGREIHQEEKRLVEELSLH